MAKPTLSDAAHEQIEQIATTMLNLQTLEYRNRDHLDFYELSVGQIRAALEAAYLAGMVDHHRRSS